MRGDGSSVNGVTFREDRWYASAKYYKGPEHFYEVDVKTIKIEASYGDSFMFPARTVIKKPGQHYPPIACFVPKKVNTRLQESGDRTHVIRGSVLEFCKNNPGVGVMIGGPGARTRNEKTSRYVRIDCGKLRATEERWDCVPAAVINAISAMGNEGATLKMEREFMNESQR